MIIRFDNKLINFNNIDFLEFYSSDFRTITVRIMSGGTSYIYTIFKLKQEETDDIEINKEREKFLDHVIVLVRNKLIKCLERNFYIFNIIEETLDLIKMDPKASSMLENLK